MVLKRFCCIWLDELPDETVTDEVLDRIALELYGISPSISFYSGEEIIVDPAPVRHLHRGEGALVHRLEETVFACGFECRIAAAPSLAGARLAVRLLAKRGRPVLLDEARETAFVHGLAPEDLLVLPDLSAASVGGRGRGVSRIFSFLGLKTVSDMLAASSSLPGELFFRAARGGGSDQRERRGRSPHPDCGLGLLLHARRSPLLEKRLRPFVHPLRTGATFERNLCFSPPIFELDGMLVPLREALGVLQAEFGKSHRLICDLLLELVDETGGEIAVDVPLARPCRDARLLCELCRLRLDRVALSAPLAECRIRVPRSCPEHRSAADLLERTVTVGASLDELENRIEAALGRGRGFFRAEIPGSELPEALERLGGATAARSVPAPAERLADLPVLLAVQSPPGAAVHARGDAADCLSAFELELYDPGTGGTVRHVYRKVRREGRWALLKERNGTWEEVGRYG